MADHEVFARFEREARFIPNWVGALTQREFFSPALEGATDFPRLRPPPNDDQTYFEWIDVLEAVTTARGRFTIYELGAGIGVWSVNAVLALRAYSGLPYRVVAVEAEPTHFLWMQEHFRANGLNSRWCRRIHAAVWDTDGEAEFYAGRPADWYGQTLVDVAGPGLNHDVVNVKTVTLNRLLRGTTCVDLLHLDIQGAELRVLAAAAASLAPVRRVHIATHSAEIESGLRKLFASLGWSCVNDYGLQTESRTPWGRIRFQDGIQTWDNPAAMTHASQS